MDPRVAPSFASFSVLVLKPRVSPILRCTSQRFPTSFGLPRALVFRLLPVMDIRFAPNSHLRRPRRRFSGLPRILALQCRLSMSLRVAPDSASSGFASGEFPGLPRLFVPSARRLVALRVAPGPAFGDAGGELPGRPGSPLLLPRLLWSSSRLDARTLQRLPAISSGSPHGFDPPACLPARCPGCPGSSFPGHPRWRWSSRVSQYSHPPVLPASASSGFPESCFNGRSDDESRFLKRTSASSVTEVSSKSRVNRHLHILA